MIVGQCEYHYLLNTNFHWISLGHCSIKLDMFRFKILDIKSSKTHRPAISHGPGMETQHYASEKLRISCLNNGTLLSAYFKKKKIIPPDPAVLTIKSSRTWLPAELPTVPRQTGTWTISLVTLAIEALAVSLTAWTPKPLPALAASRELVAWWIVTVTLECTVPPSPARVAQASPCHHITDWIDAAVAVVVALRTPEARIACAFSCFLVTLALLAKTNILAFRSPAIVVAGALAGQIIALAIGVTVTFSLAVWSPVLCRAFC